MKHPFDSRGQLFFKTFAGPMRHLAVALVASACCIGSISYAQGNDYAEVNRLIRAGQLNDAMTKVDQFLVNRPRDPQMRFLKGVIQTESGKLVDAITTFTRLSADFPELPEPYNNLAVLYASQSQFDKARSSLEMAIRTNPSYATAHENLGDVYAKLASEAYTKALQLDSSNTAVEPKLSLIRNLFTPTTAASGQTSTVASVTPPQQPTTTPVTPPVTITPTEVSPPKEPVKPVPAPTQPASNNDQEAVEASVQAWAKAWSNKNMAGYLGAYAASFTPPAGQTRSQWEAERKARIVPKSRISVGIEDLSVSVNGNRATARFRQIYVSDNLNVNSRKVLEMIKTGDRWQIVRESTGS